MIYRYNRIPEGIHIPAGAILIYADKYKKPHILVNNIEKKHCIGCNKWLPLSFFYNLKSRWDGLDTYCKLCNDERTLMSKLKRKRP